MTVLAGPLTYGEIDEEIQREITRVEKLMKEGLKKIGELKNSI